MMQALFCFNSFFYIVGKKIEIIFGHDVQMSEAPFRPREKLAEKQKYFQSIHRHTYLKGPMDKITSVAIPLALAATSIYMIVSLIVI